MTTIPLFPLNTVLFPDGHLPLQVFEVRYLDMVKKCIADERPFGVVALMQGSEVRQPAQMETLADCGTFAQIVQWAEPMPGLLHINTIGTGRFRVGASERLKTGLWMADVEPVPADTVRDVPPPQQNVANGLGALIRSLQQRGVKAEQMPLLQPYRLDEAGWVANRWCELLSLSTEQKLLLLMQQSPVLRLELVQDVLSENGLLEE